MGAVKKSLPQRSIVNVAFAAAAEPRTLRTAPSNAAGAGGSDRCASRSRSWMTASSAAALAERGWRVSSRTRTRCDARSAASIASRLGPKSVGGRDGVANILYRSNVVAHEILVPYLVLHLIC